MADRDDMLLWRLRSALEATARMPGGYPDDDAPRPLAPEELAEGLAIGQRRAEYEATRDELYADIVWWEQQMGVAPGNMSWADRTARMLFTPCGDEGNE